MRRSSSTTGPTWATRWSCTTDARRALISAEHQGRAGTEGFRPALSCLWPRWCSGRRRARPPARLGDRAALGAASRSPPVPSGPSGALHTGGACGSGVLGPRRRPWALQLMLTNFARNSPVTLSNLECASLELQRFQRLLKLPSNELRATFPGLAVYQDPWQPVGAIVRPGPRYRRAIPMCLGAIVGVFVHRYETDSTFASTSLQRNETVIAFASDERPFLGHFDPAKVLAVSVGRAVWPAKVLPVSIGACSVVCKGVGGFKAPVIASCARKSSPCSASCGCEREKVRPARSKRAKNAVFRCVGRVFSRKCCGTERGGRVFSRKSR